MYLGVSRVSAVSGEHTEARLRFLVHLWTCGKNDYHGVILFHQKEHRPNRVAASIKGVSRHPVKGDGILHQGMEKGWQTSITSGHLTRDRQVESLVCKGDPSAEHSFNRLRAS